MSTFACGGGSSMGYKLAGCEVIAANDIDPVMARHYKANLNPKHYFLCPIRDLTTSELPAELSSLDILDGSPPCSTFSVSGNREKDWGKDKHFREGQAKQILSDLFFDYLDLVERLKPRVVIAENVKGLMLGNAKGYLKLIFTRLRNLGYQPQAFLINAADCGVPQRRERIFVCAVRNDVSTKNLILNPKQSWVSSSDACADLDGLTAAEEYSTRFTAPTDLQWWPLTVSGSDYASAVVRRGGRRKLWNHQKLNGCLPSCTLPSVHDCIKHWNSPRTLTFREWKRLGSFPDDYTVDNHDIGKYLIGMSVPPRMAEVVAKAVCRQWLGVK